MLDAKTHIMRIEAPIGDHKPSIGLDEVRHAVAPRTPVDDGLHVRLDAHDGTEEFYRQSIDELLKKVPGFIEHHVGVSGTNHLSVFGFAPMPLLMLLGRMLGDKQPADVYERHRHTDSWRWDEDGPPLEWDLKFPSRPVLSRDVALLLSISGQVSSEAVDQTLHQSFDVVEITLPEGQRLPNIVRTRAQLSGFMDIWRRALNAIKASYTKPRVHCFPAAPLSVCVECGRRMLPKADPEILVYDRFGERFIHALTLRSPEPFAAPSEATRRLAIHGIRPDDQRWRQEMMGLFESAFKPSELLRLLQQIEPHLGRELPNVDVTNRSEYAFEVLSRLEERDLINDLLFNLLVDHFTVETRKRQIEQIQAGWRRSVKHKK